MLQYPHLSGLELQEAQGRVYERLNKLLMHPFATFKKADCKAWFRQIKVYMLSCWALSRCLGKPANETSVMLVD